jgi:predicted nucleic acid-binding Zn ribbon protein
MPEGVVNEKKCIGCGKPYTPTGNCQKYCPDCKSEKLPKNNKRESALLILPKSASEDTMILRMLVAIGIVSEEKIEQARQIVLKLKA